MVNPLMNIAAMSVEEIRDILFDEGAPWNEPGAGPNGRGRQMDQTFLLEMMKALVSRSERMMQNRVFELEWPFRCFMRIRQLLKNNIPKNSSNPYHSFMGQCLRDIREIHYDFDRVLSRMRTAAQFMGEVDRKMRTGRAGPSPAWLGQVWREANSHRFGFPAGSVSMCHLNRPNVGPPRGRQMGRGSRGASVPIAGVGIVRPTAGWYSFLEQVEGGPAGRGKGKGKGRGKGRSNVGAGRAGSVGNPGPSGSGSGAGGARSGPSGRDTPNSVRFSVRGRTRSPSRSPRTSRRDSTRSPSRTERMPRLTPSRSRSRATEESSDPEGRSRSRSPRRSRSRTGSRRGRDTQDEAIDLSSGEYMETDH